MTVKAEENVDEGWGIAINSIGTAGVRMISVLRSVTPLPENRIAELLFQAPSVLVAGLALEVAEQANEILRSTGLETRVLTPKETIEPGDTLHELALVVHDISKIPDLLAEIIKLIGVNSKQAKSMLCSSPTVLMGRVSAKTAEACRQRFAPLGAEIDITRVDQAIYDVFLGRCSLLERNRVGYMLRQLNLDLPDDEDRPLVAMGFSREKADRLWTQFARSNLPLKLISRDFERFDVTLEFAPDTEPMVDYLMASTGMSQKIARKVISRVPIVIQQQVTFNDMTTCLEAVSQLGGRATGQLLAFQTFVLQVHHIGNLSQSVKITELIADCSSDEAKDALQQGMIEGPLTHLQARWLQWELKQVGTETERILR